MVVLRLTKVSIGCLFLLGSLAHGTDTKTLDSFDTPQDRFQAGQKIEGVFSIHDPLHCSPSALQKMEQALVGQDEVLGFSPTHQALRPREMIATITKIANSALSPLRMAGDSALQRRHICTGFYRDAHGVDGNALSSTLGYLIFDHRMIQKLYSLPESMRSMWTLDFLVLHEVSHQLQYWNNDLEVIKKFKGLQNSKIPELAADCVAGALLKLSHRHLSEELFAASFQGAIGAAITLGDYQLEHDGHHGTPYQRGQAVQYGMSLMAALVSQTPLIPKVSSAELLSSCNQFTKTQ